MTGTSDLFIRRPVMTVLVMCSILLFGLISYRQLAVSDLPNVDYPTILVNANLPGASPETVASTVATVLEKQFATIPGIGKKTAARIALELKEKVVKIHSGLSPATIEEPAVPAGPYEDALSALVNLGYRPQDVKDALKRVSKTGESHAGLKELIREGLKELARG